MKKIASFQINHDVLTEGMYTSRIDGDIVTYDIRMEKPNAGEYLENAAMHTLEHLFATYVRNTKYTEQIIYVGPMGCRTGFYFLVRDLAPEIAIRLVQETMDFVLNFEGQIPGTNRIECGNYLEHDLQGCKNIARKMKPILANWTVEKLAYPT